MHYKQNNKESKTYVQGLRPFGNTLPRSVRGILKKNGYNYSEIISKWNLLVGKDISDYCFPKSIKMTRGDKSGTLILSVERGNEIKLKTFNSVNKKEIVKNNPGKSLKKFKKKISEIKNKDIRDSLLQLLDIVKK